MNEVYDRLAEGGFTRAGTRMDAIPDEVLANTLRLSDIATAGGPEDGCVRAKYLADAIADSGTGLQRKVRRLLRDGVLAPSEISVRAVAQAFSSVPAKVSFPDPASGKVRTITASAGTAIINEVIEASFLEGYESFEGVGEMLTRPYRSRLATSSVPSIMSGTMPHEVEEGGQYPEGGVIVESVSIGHKKMGRVLNVTEEMIAFDHTEQIVGLAGEMGAGAAEAIEKLILNRIADNVSYDGVRVYQPDGVPTALYSTTARALGTNKVTSNPLADETDVANARALLAGMTRYDGEKLRPRARFLLVPEAQLDAAAQVLSKLVLPDKREAFYAPAGRYRPELVASAFLDEISTSTWYLGDFPMQFVRKIVIDVEPAIREQRSEALFKADIARQFKVRFDVECGSRDYRWVVQSTA